MATASVNRGMLWTDLEGRELNGRWRLNRLVRPEGRTAWFEAADAEGSPAMLSVTETLNDEDELLERLKAAAAIRNPNVVAIRDAAIVRLDDVPLVIAAMERTEENLGDVLRERALSAAEARQVLDAVLAGLAAIHGSGLTHGRIDASSVLAMGETVKLRSDCLQIPGPDFAARASDDVRGVGRLVAQTVTRRIPVGENDPVLQLVPEPMARAARQALTGRATIEEIAALAGMRIVAREAHATAPAAAAPVLVSPAKAKDTIAPITVTEAPPSAAPSGLSTGAGAEPMERATQTEVARPVVVGPAADTPHADVPRRGLGRNLITPAENDASHTRPMRGGMPVDDRQDLILEPSLMQDDEPEWEKRRSAPWLIVGAATLVVITLFVVYGMLHRGAAAKTAATTPAQTVPAPARSTAARPAVRAEAGPAPRGASAPAAGLAAAVPGWRVVVYTYDRREDAQHKAATIAQRYPRMEPGVYAPRGGKYLVTLGPVMSRAQAFRLRNEAVRLGLPRDTYAQDFR